MSNFVIAYIVFANKDEATHIAKAIVEEKLAACANILPAVESFYMWQGKVQNCNEVVLVAKTEKTKFELLQKKVTALHSYELPCIVALPIEMGEAKYLQWISNELK
ncbi:MAG: divalent-cation tolerance protein CutA [Flavobacteriales bacterium]